MSGKSLKSKIEELELVVPEAKLVTLTDPGSPVVISTMDVGAISRGLYASKDGANGRQPLELLAKRLQATPAAIRQFLVVHLSGRIVLPFNLTADDFVKLIMSRVEGDRGKKGFDGSATVYIPKSLDDLVREEAERQLAQTLDTPSGK
jgi:hypothetical protein